MTQIDLVPRDYTEMHRLWFPFMVNLVGRSGIHKNNREDVASDIFVRIMEWDILDAFDPGIVFDRQDGAHPARFKNFLSSVVLTYVRGHRDRQFRLHRRELQLLSGDLSEHIEATQNPSQLRHTMFEPVPDHSDLIIEAVMEEQTAANIRKLLAKVPKRSAHDTCDLPRFFDAVRAQILDTGVLNVQELTTIFGVSASAMYVWIRWLRANLADIYGITVTPRRLRRSTPGPS